MENKHTPEGKWITRVMHGKLYVVVEIGHNNYHAIATVHDSSVENAELIARAPSLQSEIDRLKEEKKDLIEAVENIAYLLYDARNIHYVKDLYSLITRIK